MNFKTTVLLLVLLAAVGIYFGVEHFAGTRNAETAVTNTNKLVAANTDDISKVSITRSDGGKIVLAKTGAEWRLSEPLDAPADKFAVEDLLRQITSLQSRGELPADRKSSVGLDKPRATVEVTAGGKTTKLQFGDQNKVGDSLYVLVDDQSTPRIVGTAIYDQLDKQPDTYRSKKLTDLASSQTDEVKQLAITTAGKTIRLEKQGTSWQIVDPKKMPADSSGVGSILFAIADLNASEFVPTPSAPASYGLASPATKVWFSTSAPADRSATQPATQPAGTTIEFGRFVSLDQKDVYTQVNSGPIATVPATTLDSFKKTALDLRDKKVVDIEPTAVESFTLAVNRPATTQPTTRPAEMHEYTIARRKEAPKPIGPVAPATQPALASTQPSTNPSVATTQPEPPQPSSKWVVESGASGDANDSQVEALLSALHPLRADKFLDSYATTRPAGDYTLTIHVGPSNGHGPQDYTIRLSNPGPTGPSIGTSDDLTFETDRTILDKLDVNFKGGK